MTTTLKHSNPKQNSHYFRDLAIWQLPALAHPRFSGKVEFQHTFLTLMVLVVQILPSSGYVLSNSLQLTTWSRVDRHMSPSGRNSQLMDSL